MLLSLAKKIEADACLILASGSPRRRDILSKTLPDLTFHVVPSEGEEPRPDESDVELKSKPWKYPERSATFKGREVFQRLLKNGDFKKAQNGRGLLVVGADTVVYNDDFLLKPRNVDEAKSTLKSLGGKTHQVYTGVAIFTEKCPEPVVFSVKTDVTFDDITDDDIDSYVATKEPLDKAGAYGIQAIGSSFVKEIKGDYFNVEGFPVHAFCKHMKNIFNS